MEIICQKRNDIFLRQPWQRGTPIRPDCPAHGFERLSFLYSAVQAASRTDGHRGPQTGFWEMNVGAASEFVDFFSPQPNPQEPMSYMTSAWFGSPRVSRKLL